MTSNHLKVNIQEWLHGGHTGGALSMRRLIAYQPSVEFSVFSSLNSTTCDCFSAQNSLRSSTGAGRRHSSRSAMKVLVDSIQRSETPRPKSPHMNNEEPIELAHFPAAKPPPPGEQPKIERDDFPAPPYPYTDPERRKRWSDSYKGELI